MEPINLITKKQEPETVVGIPAASMASQQLLMMNSLPFWSKVFHGFSFLNKVTALFPVLRLIMAGSS